MDQDLELEYLHRQKRTLEHEYIRCLADTERLRKKTENLSKQLTQLQKKKSSVILLRMQALGWPNKQDKRLFYQIGRLKEECDSMWSTCESLLDLLAQLYCQLTDNLTNIDILVNTSSSSSEEENEENDIIGEY